MEGGRQREVNAEQTPCAEVSIEDRKKMDIQQTLKGEKGIWSHTEATLRWFVPICEYDVLKKKTLVVFCRGKILG